MKSRKIFFNNIIAGSLVFLLFLLWSFSAVQSVYAAVEVSATLNATSFPLDRAAALTITVTGSRSAKPHLPQVEGLRFHQRGQSTQMNFVNGTYSASVSSVVLVEAFHAGQFVIPAIEVDTNDGTVMTEPVKFEVTDSQTAVRQAQNQTGSATSRLRSGEADKVAFLRVTPTKEKSYIGEIVPIQIKVYFRSGIKANLNSLPQLQAEGFVLQQLEREPDQTQEIINNSQYNVLTWNSALSGIKEGKHSVSVEIAATLLMPEQRSSPFGGHGIGSDPFFNNFFSSYREKEVQVANPVRDMTVLALPLEGKPDNFSGAIGEFQLDVTASPLELAPGDPITLKMTMRGQGNFDRVQAPKLSTEKGWKTYTPASEFLKDGAAGQGKKVFEQALVLKDQSLREIPTVEFSYFDPVKTVYKTLSVDAVPFKLKGVTLEKVEPLPSKQEVVQQSEATQKIETKNVVPPLANLAPLQLDIGDTDRELTPLFTKKWFQLLAGFLVLALLGTILFKVRAARYANNPRLQQEQAMKHLLLVRLQEVEQTLANNDSRGFLASCKRAIQEQFGLVWETEAGAITYTDLQQRLSSDSSLLPLFRAADESAYGGQGLSSGQMQRFAGALKKELEGLV